MRHKPLLRFALAIGASIPLLVLLQMLVLNRLPNSEFFMPHGHCYLWDPTLLAIHAGSDSFIGLSYIIISITLGYLLYRAHQDLPFQWLLVAFGLFIIACGGTHVMEVITLWTPAYWLSGSVKLITALSSVATAVVLPPIIPKVLHVLHAARESDTRKTELEGLYSRLKEEDELKTQFFANISHELRTPLTLILGPVQKMLSQEGLPEAQRSDLLVVERNATILLKHVNDLLDIAKLDASKMELHLARTDLATLVRRMASHFEFPGAERSITLHVQTPPELPAAIDQEKIDRVLLNLLSNAFKFTPDGGIVACTLALRDGAAVIEVRDSGPGIPPALRGSVFERFRQVQGGTTRQHGGTGLGLSIVREFVELHGGTVEIGDAPEGGALFSVTLPLGADAETDAGIIRENTSEELARPTVMELGKTAGRHAPLSGASTAPLVLVVEDNVDMSNFISDTLSSQFRVATAFNGQEGYQAALELRPDLVVSDVMMPGVSGEQLVHLLRNHPELESMPILLLTAKARNEALVKLLGEGVQDYLGKPFSAYELRARAHNLVSMKRAVDLLRKELASHSHNLTELAAELAGRKNDLQHALELLAQSEAKMRRLVDANIIGVFFTHTGGRVSEANDRFLEMIGYSREELAAGDVDWIGITPQEFRDHDQEVLAELRQHGAAPPWEKEYIRKDGTRIPVLVGGALLADSDSECVAFAIDLTERKRMEQALLAAKNEAEAANRAKDGFLAILSHELRTPLTPMMTAVTALQGEPDHNDETRLLLDIVANNILIEIRLIEDLLDMTRLFSGKLRLNIVETNAHSMLLGALSELEDALHRKGLAVTVNIDAEHSWVAADPDRLHQVFSNILKNALKFTPAGGTVTLSSRNSEDASRLLVEIRDSGVGITAEALGRIFNPFEQGEQDSMTRRFGGLGLGLAIGRQLIEMMGGTLTAESEGENLGAVLTISLPVVP